MILPRTSGNLSGGTIQLRVTPDLMHRLRSGAALEGMPFAQYVRAVLQQNLELREELVSLRRILLDQGQSPSNQYQAPEASSTGLGDPRQLAAALESLALLRQLAGPERIRSAHADLKRLSLTPVRLV